MKLKLLFAASAVALIAAGACGGMGDMDHSGGSNAPASEEAPEEAQEFGEAGNPKDADETVKVRALDDLSFDPPELTVSQGDTVLFIVTNDGKTAHEFVLGSEAYQEEHEQAMEHGGAHGEDLGNSIDLPPGETAEVAWTFTEPGEVLYACHVDGHYDGGMFGTVTVNAE